MRTRTFARGLALLVLCLVAAVVPTYAQSVANGTISTSGADCSTTTNCVTIVSVDFREAPSFGVYINVATSGTFNFEATIDGLTWFAVQDDVNGAATQTADGARFFSNPGYRQFRVRASAISGAADVDVVLGSSGMRSTATLSGAAQGDGALQDGANASIEATVFDYTNSNPLAVRLVDGNGDPATIGGGAQYTEGDIDTTITGTAIMFESNTGTSVLSVVSNSTPLPISDAGGSITVDGSVTVSGTATVVGGKTNNNAAPGANNIGALIGIANASAPTWTEGNLVGASFDLGGALRVSGATGGGTEYDHSQAITPASANGTVIGGRVSASAPSTSGVIDDDFALAWFTAPGSLTSNPRDAAGAQLFGTATAFSTGVSNPTLGGVFTFNYCKNGGGTWDPCLSATTTEATHNGPLTADSVVGGVGMLLAKDQDGAALPNVVSAEGDAVIPAGSLYGVTYVMAVNEDGSTVGHIICDSGCGSGTVYDHGEAITLGSANGVIGGGRVSAAAPSTTGVVDDDFVANWMLNTGAAVTQPSYGGVLAVAGNGASGTGVQRVTIANDSTGILAGVTTVSTVTTLSQLGGVALPIEDAPETAAGVGIYSMSVRRDTAAPSATTAGDNATVNTDALGLLWTRNYDPCNGKAKVFVNVSQTTGTQLFTGTASNRTYICSVNLVTATAQNIALVSGTGTVCATGSAGMFGGTTAATGWNLAANGGLTFGGADASLSKSGADADNVCLLQSGSGQISGSIGYVVAPNQ